MGSYPNVPSTIPGGRGVSSLLLLCVTYLARDVEGVTPELHPGVGDPEVVVPVSLGANLPEPRVGHSGGSGSDLRLRTLVILWTGVCLWAPFLRLS